MYNVTTLLASLSGLVGFAPQDGPSDLRTSRSGLWVSGAHALITGGNLSRSIADDDVRVGLAIKTAFSDSIAQVLAAVRNRKLALLETKLTLLKPTELYEGEGAISDAIQKQNRFVGLRVNVPYGPTRAVILHRIGLQATGAVELPVYVYKSGSTEPLATITYSRDRTARMRWQVLTQPVRLPAGNSYLIGYYENNLTGVQAIRRVKTIGPLQCSGCDIPNTKLYDSWKEFVTVQDVRIDSTLLGEDGLIENADDGDVLGETNYGLNLTIGAECDLTSIILQQQNVLAEAIQQQIVVRLLSEIAYSTRTTAIEQQIRDKANYALKHGEEAKLEERLNAVVIALSDLDPRCLPVTNAAKMVVRTNLFGR